MGSKKEGCLGNMGPPGAVSSFDRENLHDHQLCLVVSVVGFSWGLRSLLDWQLPLPALCLSDTISVGGMGSVPEVWGQGLSKQDTSQWSHIHRVSQGTPSPFLLGGKWEWDIAQGYLEGKYLEWFWGSEESHSECV